MIVEFVGGADDGMRLDLDEMGRPGTTWWCPEFERMPLPATLEVRTVRCPVAVYRMTAASPEVVVYQLDPVLSAEVVAQRVV